MGTMWRPAVRCDSAYREFINSLYVVTTLDKNQIIRLMMFVAANSNEFKQIISEYKKGDTTTLPVPEWRSWEDGYWLNQTYKRKGVGGVNATPELPRATETKKVTGTYEHGPSSTGTEKADRCERTSQGRIRTFQERTGTGVIKVTFT